MRIGDYQELVAVKETPHGYYFADDEETVLLPRKECPKGLRYGNTLRLFVYTDSEDRPVATTKQPKAVVGEFAALEVVGVSGAGAFLDWGLDKDLFCPIREQLTPMRVGEMHVVRVYLDEVSRRVVCTAKVGRYLKSTGDGLEVGQKVKLMVSGRSPDALTVIIDESYRGSLYPDEQTRPLRIGEIHSGYIKQIRDRDGKIAVSLRPQGFASVLGERERVVEAVRQAGGFLAVSDRSSPEEIQDRFGISKGSFKKLIGTLYKDGVITIEANGIRLTSPSRARSDRGSA